jgi:hypothetical protein
LIPAITAILALMAVVSAPVLSGYQPGRALNWSFSVLAIGLLLSISANSEFFARELKSVRILHLAAVLSLACTFYFSSNIELARRGLTRPLAGWRRTMIERIHITGEDVVLPAIERPTPLLSESGVLEHSDHWLNRCVAAYLHVRSVVPGNTCGVGAVSEISQKRTSPAPARGTIFPASVAGAVRN